MVKLAVIADDFTGALDTGIKFAQTGAGTKMVIGTDIDFGTLPEDCEIIIVDTETRHRLPAESYGIVYDLVRRCIKQGIRLFYKKTDSAMRGCVGAELSALSDAAGTGVHFVPALPAENRYTRDGILYINGTPVSRSVFGRDPFEPVKFDRVEDIIRDQSDAEVICVPDGEAAADAGKGSIAVYDAADREEMTLIAEKLRDADRLSVTAGCAGFAEILQKMLRFDSCRGKKLEHAEGVFTVCGTVNDRTLSQLAYAASRGFERITLSPEQKLRPDYLNTAEGKAFLKDLENKCRADAPVIVDVDPGAEEKESTLRAAADFGISSEDLRERIARRLGEIIACWMDFGLEHILILSGGDTVYGFLEQIGVREVTPIREVRQGAVMFQIETNGRTMNIVSKSGGFGTEDFFVKTVPLLMNLQSGGSEESINQKGLCRS